MSILSGLIRGAYAPHIDRVAQAQIDFNRQAELQRANQLNQMYMMQQQAAMAAQHSQDDDCIDAEYEVVEQAAIEHKEL